VLAGVASISTGGPAIDGPLMDLERGSRSTRRADDMSVSSELARRAFLYTFRGSGSCVEHARSFIQGHWDRPASHFWLGITRYC
jgi:hypothetical protein